MKYGFFQQNVGLLSIADTPEEALRLANEYHGEDTTMEELGHGDAWDCSIVELDEDDSDNWTQDN